MPPKSTRKTSATRSTQTQGTLAFGTQNKITKPSSTSTGKKSLSKSALANVVDAVAEPFPTPESIHNDPAPPSPQQPHSPPPTKAQSLPHRKPHPRAPPSSPPPHTKTNPAVEASPLPDPLESKAHALPDSQIKRYWKAKESARIAPRVHQQGLSLHEKILREFDLSSQFGPCIGITRMKRWKRAEGLGLRPPLEVLAVLVRERENGVEGGWERAAMEGLLSSRVAEV